MSSGNISDKIVTGWDELHDAPWKYVVIAGEPNVVRFADCRSGIQHMHMVQPGERAIAAGLIFVLDSEWCMANAESTTLGINGQPEDDAKMLEGHLGVPPTL